MNMPIFAAVWTLIAFAPPASAPSTAPATQPARLSADDERVINLCLVEFRRHEHGPLHADRRDKELIVHRETNEGGNWYLSQGQIEAESRKVKVPQQLIAALNERARRDEKRALDHFVPDDARVVVGDVSRATTGRPHEFAFLEFPKRFPNAGAYVRIWLPAYSDDGREAIFRFFFGPSGHGASATFLLRKNARGHWAVVAAEINYYA